MSLSAGRSTGSPLNNLHWNNVGLMLAQRLLRWPNIKPTSFNVQCLPEADLIILEGGGRITNNNLLCRKLGWIHRTGRSNLHFAIWSTQLWWRPPRVSTVHKVLNLHSTGEYPPPPLILEPDLLTGSHHTQYVEPMLIYCWSNVVDAEPTLNQHWFKVSCLTSYYVQSGLWTT